MAEEVPSELPAVAEDSLTAPADASPAADAPAANEYPLITEISLPPAPAPARRTQEQAQQPAPETTPFAAPSAGTDVPLSELSPGVTVEGVTLSSPVPSPGAPESQASGALLSEQDSGALVSAQDSTASTATTARRRKDKTFRQVGTELVEMVSSV